MFPSPLTLPLRFFPGRSKTLKKVTKGIIGNLFYILCGNFHEKKKGYHLARGRVSRQSQRVRGGVDATSVLDILIRHFEKYLHTMMLTLTEHAGITTFLL